MLLLLRPAVAAENTASSLGLSVDRQGTLRRAGKPFRAIGVNYFNAFQRRLQNPQDSSFEDGFKALAAARIPFVRIMGCGFWPKEQKLYLENKEEFFRRLDAVIQAAERHGIGVIPSLFWHTATVPDLVGEPVSAWGNPQGKTQAYLRDYVRDVVGRYRHSPAIWGWEFGNEYNLAANLPNAASHRPPVWPSLGTPKTRSALDERTFEGTRAAFAAFAAEVRRHDPLRILSTGNSIPRESAWHNWKERSWKHDTSEQYAEMLRGDNPDPINVISIHAYGDCSRRLREAQAIAQRAEKPLFVGEFGAEGHNDATRQEFFTLLKAIEDAKVPLAALWVFDYARQPKCTVTAANDRSYQFQAVAEANARIRKELAQ